MSLGTFWGSSDDIPAEIYYCPVCQVPRTKFKCQMVELLVEDTVREDRLAREREDTKEAIVDLVRRWWKVPTLMPVEQMRDLLQKLDELEGQP
jgi:hypothetical protein